ncbi:hypothetical protein CHS0354_040631 [Potamilus streckersoni]|uniref:Uncharacterized protein n=1 Tax=Potamilus streckersoni TaxID=2493646 RepID=A0AAE0SHV0_9BIVA|nr:hypothetical protein CHS0354_040631 [Potamilus streckersoni]
MTAICDFEHISRYVDKPCGWDNKSDLKRVALFKRSVSLSWTGKVCVPGERTSIVQTEDYLATVLTATHELGHR